MDERLLIKEACDIVILGGQSNAVGSGHGEMSEPIDDHPEAFVLHDTQYEGYLKDEHGRDILSVQAPFTFTISPMGLIGNIASVFVDKYIKDGRLQAGRKILIIRAAVGGTGFFKHEWSMDGVLFCRLREMIRLALSMNEDNRVVALCWHQGESDAFERRDMDVETRTTAYEAYFETFLREVRKLCKNDKLPVMTGGFTDEWSNTLREQCDAVMGAIQAVCDRVGYARFHSAEGLLSNNQLLNNGDDIHFCRESSRLLGVKYYNTFVEMMK